MVQRPKPADRARCADGQRPDAHLQYTNVLPRGKKHDYFTAALPFAQKGTAVQIPLGTTAPVVPNMSDPVLGSNAPFFSIQGSTWPGPLQNSYMAGTLGSANITFEEGAPGGSGIIRWGTTPNSPGLVVDLSQASAATINTLRLGVTTQQLLEKDARGGTRYVENIREHFGVRPPDYRLQRPEYIGGGKTMVNSHPVAQTSESDGTPQGNIAAFTTAHGGGHCFNYAATEHGVIIGLVNVRTDLTYQQGTDRMWTKQTRGEYYFPVFANIGEQPVYQREIFTTGTIGNDETVFGYQEAWAEYRYTPNKITGLFRSTTPNNIDIWHYGEEFDSSPALNADFIIDPSKTVLARSMAVGDQANGQQILFDALTVNQATRPMPTYSVPGLKRF